MKCPVCKTDNTSGIKYCINCGMSLENPPEISYEQVDRGIYHTEEEYLSKNNGFEMSDGVFTVNDVQSSYISRNLFTAEELNDSVEEFDFSGQSENNPAEEFDFGGQSENNLVEEFDFGGQSENNPAEEFDFGGQSENNPAEEFDFGGQSENNPAEEFDFGGQSENNPVEEFDFKENMSNVTPNNSVYASEEPLASQSYADYANNSVPLPAPPYNDIYGNPPQIIGYDQNGTPIYGQQTVYQPQFIGYDQNGMPVYAQSQMYQSPQIMGYDQNGMPIYAQSQMYQTPQFMGYDQNGMPIYGQSAVYPENPVSVVSQNVPAETKQDDDTAEKFMDFLDDEENKGIEQSEEDFFGKSSDMGDINLPVPDVGSLKKREHKKKVYMTDVEIKDAENLVPNTAGKFSQKYMKRAENFNSNDLGEKKTFTRKVSMGETRNVDSRMLNPKFNYKSRIRMGDAGQADPDQLKAHVSGQKKFTMAEADHAVEALPKKKKYVDELDLIELPEYMQARKKAKKDDNEFPSMTDL